MPRNVHTAPASGERTRSVTAAWSMGEAVISIIGWKAPVPGAADATRHVSNPRLRR